ncbi:Hypothetical predicted protein [Xyrichtys novacula]|uniref:Uncharacterized protein n=1 Tax=Xyrichtys novacula TaxID=13765 RepID=A0AAV1FRC9_XYRNO|nr:Hypothetical predicted protein [Xyrichtys novacula]
MIAFFRLKRKEEEEEEEESPVTPTLIQDPITVETGLRTAASNKSEVIQEGEDDVAPPDNLLPSSGNST